MANTFDDGSTRQVELSGLTQADFVSESDRLYIKAPDMPLSANTLEKVRIVTSSITFVSPDSRIARPTDEFSIPDSIDLDVGLSLDALYDEAVYNLAGHFKLDEYIGDPRDDELGTYKTLANFIRDLQQYTVGYNPNNFIRLFESFDRSLYNQLEALAPMRSNASTGLSLGRISQLNPNKEPRKRPSGENIQYESTVGTMSGSLSTKLNEKSVGALKSITGSIDTKIFNKVVGCLFDNGYIVTSSILGQQVGTGCFTGIISDCFGNTCSGSRNNSSGVVNISGSVAYEYFCFTEARTRALYCGMRMSAPDINLPTDETTDGNSVVEVVTLTDKGIRINT